MESPHWCQQEKVLLLLKMKTHNNNKQTLQKSFSVPLSTPIYIYTHTNLVMFTKNNTFLFLFLLLCFCFIWFPFSWSWRHFFCTLPHTQKVIFFFLHRKLRALVWKTHQQSKTLGGKRRFYTKKGVIKIDKEEEEWRVWRKECEKKET